MPISNAWSRLTPDVLAGVPRAPGVYELATLVRNTVFIGRTEGRDLRDTLKAELANRESMIRRRALYFRYEQTQDDGDRQLDLLEEYAEAHDGGVPPMNQPTELDQARARATKRPAHAAGRGQLRAVS
jgi:hypothetical protein